MIQLLILLGVSMCLAYCSQNEILVIKLTEKIKLDLPLIIIVLILSLFCGLRTFYNDTELYIYSFSNSESLKDFINSQPKLTENPLFHSYRIIFRHYVSSNANLYLFTIALFSLWSTLRFIRKYSESFVFSIFLFFVLGQFVLQLAAMKQCLAIAVLTYAIEALLKKRYFLFYLIVFIALLFHTYAIFFVILPLFINKPWTLITYITLTLIVFFLFFFESAIDAFFTVSDSTGKFVDKKYVLESEGINFFRLAVYAVPPLISFCFLIYLDNFYDKQKSIFMNMSILAFVIMCLGIFKAANLFGRSAMYFDIGTIIILPSLINRIFNKSSARFITLIGGAFYLIFFLYDINNFSNQYRAITLFRFIYEIVASSH